MRQGGTWGVYFLEPISSQETKLHLVSLGWREGEEWDEAFAYFLQNNPRFLNQLWAKLAADTAAVPGKNTH